MRRMGCIAVVAIAGTAIVGRPFGWGPKHTVGVVVDTVAAVVVGHYLGSRC